MEGFKPEHRERPSGVDLRVVRPSGDKHHMIGFDAKTVKEAKAYHKAIAHYLKRFKIPVFLQVGGNSELGYNAWEIWDKNITPQELEALLPEIERDAQILMTVTDFEDLYEQLYKRWDTERI